MKQTWQNSWFTIPVLLFFNIGLILAYFVPYGYEILLFNPLRYEPLNSFFRLITYLGEIWPYLIAGLAALFWRYRYALLIALAGLIILPTSFFIKEQVGTDRPITWFRNQDMHEAVIIVPGVELNVGPTSFPSGHTMAAFGLYGLLMLIAGKKYRHWGLTLALLAILVGVSRIFLVQHFLADVLAGALLGLAVSWLVWQLNAKPFLRGMVFLDKKLNVRLSDWVIG